ncbi:MAG: dephospho-CoA kinase [Phascolarctobacterium sp.]|nr:dephospho-CoA kinase [Phascolarctobacterium sp.]
MIVIGLTGGIASGKSTVAGWLREIGLPVFDVDEVSKKAVVKGSIGLKMVEEALGSEYITDEGALDRAKVAALVFKNKEALKKLESIIHKIVWEKACNFLDECRRRQCKAVVLDVPLLIECGWHNKVDLVWLVAVNTDEQIRRAVLRSDMSKVDVKARIDAQMPLEEKKALADKVFDNSNSPEITRMEVYKEVHRILSENTCNKMKGAH